MDSEDMDFDPDMLIPSWVHLMDWNSVIWENKNHDLVDVRNISPDYARNLMAFIDQRLDSVEMRGLISRKEVMSIRTSRFWEALEEKSR